MQVAGLYGGAVQKLERITFLGRGAMVLGQFGVNYVQDRAQKWGVPWKIISRMGPAEAKAATAPPRGRARLLRTPGDAQGEWTHFVTRIVTRANRSVRRGAISVQARNGFSSQINRSKSANQGYRD